MAGSEGSLATSMWNVTDVMGRAIDDHIRMMMRGECKKPKKNYPVMRCSKCKRRLDTPEDWEKIPQLERDSYLKYCGEVNEKPNMLCCYCLHDYFNDLGLTRHAMFMISDVVVLTRDDTLAPEPIQRIGREAVRTVIQRGFRHPASQ